MTTEEDADHLDRFDYRFVVILRVKLTESVSVIAQPCRTHDEATKWLDTAIAHYLPKKFTARVFRISVHSEVKT